MAVSSSQLAAGVGPVLLPTANCQLPTAPRPPTTAPLIIGHRGAAADAPENTLVSFERAISDGADGIEFDVRLAGDNVPVVVHDPTLRRTARRRGRISAITSSELKDIDVGTWFNLRYPKRARAEFAKATIPTLSDVFQRFFNSGARLYVEMKCDARDRSELAAEVAMLVADHSLLDHVVVESFDLRALAEIKRVEPRLRTAALFDRKPSHPAPLLRSMIERALRAQASEIALHKSLAFQRAAQAAIDHDLSMVVWTVDSPSWVDRALARDIRALITNRPKLLCARRAQLLVSG